MVYTLARYINREQEIIPESTLGQAPSAELRPNQTDQDTLRPTTFWTKCWKLLIEKGRSTREIVAEGFDEKTVLWSPAR